MSWTQERVTMIGKLWNEGMSASQIARQIGGVTKNSVISKLHREGISARGVAVSIQQRARAPGAPKRIPTMRTSPQPIAFTAPCAPLNIPLATRTAFQCHVVSDDSEFGRPLYCGHPVHPDSSYCAGHHARFYTHKPKPQERALPRLSRRADYRDAVRWAGV